MVIEDVLSAAELHTLNGLIDEQGIAPSTPEVLADGSEGSRVRFGSSGGGMKNTGPGLLDWGQPFVVRAPPPQPGRPSPGAVCPAPHSPCVKG